MDCGSPFGAVLAVGSLGQGCYFFRACVGAFWGLWATCLDLLRFLA